MSAASFEEQWNGERIHYHAEDVGMAGEWFERGRNFERQGIHTTLAALQADLDAMTVDRDLWREDHGDDCPYKDQLEMAQEVIREYQEQIARLASKQEQETSRDVVSMEDHASAQVKAGD